ncbi:MAG: HAMP domain-containing histidine kinase [Bacteroidetes bacterium]|nr:HAMP domain-containing histidine kinase [Bacteroidota bacterium]
MEKSLQSRRKAFLFGHLSIQQRLPLFICILLLIVVTAFSCVSYIEVKNASMAAARERVTTLADKLTLMFKGSVDQYVDTLGKVANNKDVKEFIKSGSVGAHARSLELFQTFFKKDTTNKLLQILDRSKNTVIRLGDNSLDLKLNIDSMPMSAINVANMGGAGRFVLYKGSMYYPVGAAVIDSNKVIGYVVDWKLLRGTKQSVEQLGQLLGANGRLFFGNDDNSFWTNMVQPVAKPSVALARLQQVAEYTRQSGGPVVGSVRKIPDSRWLILVEFSSRTFLETANVYLRWVTIIGIVLVVAGSFGGWMLSRSMTAPIDELGRAASAIADGDYSAVAQVRRKDEVGQLAESFNIMAARVRQAQQGLEQKVEETEKELQTAITGINDQKENEKKKDEFISIASHELKTPLTTIKAFFQLAVKEMQPEFKTFSLIHRASRQLTRMERLIEDLLDVSKINSGKMQYDLEDFDFQQALKEAVDSVQQIFPDHSLVIEHSASVIVHGDRHRIEQVIINLLNNAVKYSPGADKVLIRSELVGGHLMVTIEDFGIGIDEQHIGELFDRFYRVNSDRHFQGLGLGLFISSEIIKRHGGSIKVESEPGKGSAFTFELPVTMLN